MEEKRRVPVWVIIVGIILLFNALGIFFGLKYFTEKGPSTSSNAQSAIVVSGVVGINGIAPNGSTIAINVRKSGDENFTTVVQDVAAIDGAVWNWEDAQKGIAYEIQANVIANGQTLGTSQVLTAVAPATNETLDVNLAGNPTSDAANAVVSGAFDLNGYIPAGASITISTRQDDGTFRQVETSLSAVDHGSWSWSGANANQTYDMLATLVVNGQNVAQSKILKVTAPAHNEIFIINSPIKAPAVKGSISGKYNVNGSVPSGATISLGSRITGSNNAFTMVQTNIAPNDGSSWVWNEGQAGTSYDVQAYLVQNGNVISSSSILTVTAPATGEVLTINVQNQPAAPPIDALLVTCMDKNSSNQWRVHFTLNNNSVVPQSQQYQLSAGTNSGNNSLINVTIDPQSVSRAEDYNSNYLFTEGQTYFAQWSYATCANCGTFSKTSASHSFTCVQPTATRTPSSTSAPAPTTPPTAVPPTVAPTATPIPSPTLVPVATITPTVAPLTSPTPNGLQPYRF